MNYLNLEKIKAFFTGKKKGSKGCWKTPNRAGSLAYDLESVASVPLDDRKSWHFVLPGPLVPCEISESTLPVPSFAVKSDNVDLRNLCKFNTCGHGHSDASSGRSVDTGSSLEDVDEGFLSLEDSVDEASKVGNFKREVSSSGGTRKWDEFVVKELKVPSSSMNDVRDEDLGRFQAIYQRHCEVILDCALNFDLGLIKSHWVNFWDGIEVNPMQLSGSGTYALSREKIVSLCCLKEVQEYICELDMIVYEKIIHLLIPDVLYPVEDAVAEGIWKFAGRIQGWMNIAMEGYPREMLAFKYAGVTALSRELLNHVTINQRAKLVAKILQERDVVTQMLTDFSSVEFRSLEEEVSWFCGPNQALFMGLRRVIEDSLLESLSLKQWAIRVEGVVSRVFPEGLTAIELFEVLRDIILENLFFSGLIIQDLDVKEKKSTGSLNTLLQLYNEYVYYLAKKRIAQAAGILPVAVMTKGFDVTDETSMTESPCASSDRSGSSRPSSFEGFKSSDMLLSTPRSMRRLHMLRLGPLGNMDGAMSPESPMKPGTPSYMASRLPW